jgi:hypothetical protein
VSMPFEIVQALGKILVCHGGTLIGGYGP